MKRYLSLGLMALAFVAASLFTAAPAQAANNGTETQVTVRSNPNCFKRTGGGWPANSHWFYCGTEADHALPVLETMRTLLPAAMAGMIQNNVTVYVYENSDDEAKATFDPSNPNSPSFGTTLQQWTDFVYALRQTSPELGNYQWSPPSGNEVHIYSAIPDGGFLRPRFDFVPPEARDHAARHEIGHVADFIRGAGVQYSLKRKPIPQNDYYNSAGYDRTNAQSKDPNWSTDGPTNAYFLAQGKEYELFAEEWAMAWESKTLGKFQGDPLDNPVIHKYFTCTWGDVYSIYTTNNENLSCTQPPLPPNEPPKG